MSPRNGKPRARQIVWIVLAAGILTWAALRLLPSDARRINARLDELASLVEKTAGEGQLVGAGKGRKIGELLTPSFEIVITPYGERVTDRGELLRLSLAYRSGTSTVDADFRDRRLEIGPAGRTATLETVAVLSGRDGEIPRREAYRVTIAWRLDGGQWLIERLEVLEVLEGLAPLL